MAGTITSLLYRIEADTSAVERGIANVNKHTSDSEGFLKRASSGLLSFVGAGIGIGAVAGGFELVRGALESFVGEAKRSQDTTAQMNAALKSTHGQSGQTAASMNELADKLSKTTTFSAETTRAAETLALRFGHISGTIFPQVIIQAQNLSARMGVDLNTAIRLVGKATDDPIKGLTNLQRVGITFDEATKNNIKTLVAHGQVMQAQQVILDALSVKFGGAAEAAGTTFAGKLKILNNQFEDVKVKIGTALIPILYNLLSAILPIVLAVVDFVPKLVAFGQAVASNGVLQTGLRLLATTLGGLVGWIKNFASGLKDANPLAVTLAAVISTVAVAMAALKIGSLIGSFIAFVPVMQAQIALWWLDAAAVWAANAPLIIIIGTIAAVIAIIVLVVTHLGFFQQAWLKVQQAIGGIIKWFGSLFGSILGAIGAGAQNVITFVTGWGGKLLDLYTWPYRMLLGFLGGFFGTLLGAIGQGIGKLVGFITGVAGGIYDALHKPLGDMLGRMGFFFNDWGQKVHDGILHLAQLILGLALNVYDALFKPWLDFVRALLTWFGNLIGTLGTQINREIAFILTFAGRIKDGMFKGFGDMLGSMGGFFGALLGFLGGAINREVTFIFGFAGHIKDSMFKGFGDMLGGMGAYFGALAGAVGNGIGVVLGKILSFAQQVRDALTLPFRNTIQMMTGLFKGMANIIISAINNFVFGAIDRLINGISSVVDWVTDKLAIGKPLAKWETGNPIPNIPSFHRGGVMQNTGLAIVGREGAEELVVLPRGANVIDHSRTKQLMQDVMAEPGGNIGDGGSPFDWLGQQKDKVVAAAGGILGSIGDWVNKGAGWLVDHAWDAFHLDGLSNVPLLGNLGNSFKNDIKQFLGIQLAAQSNGAVPDNLTAAQLQALLHGGAGVQWWLAHITQGFHPRTNPTHGGVDFGVPFHSRLEALLGGTVRSAGYYPWGGEVDLWTTLGGRRFIESYVHLDWIPPEMFQMGRNVPHGAFVGLSGGENPGYPGAMHPTGRSFSSGPHLHYNWFDHAPWANDDLNPTAFLMSLRGAPQMRADGGWITEPVMGVGLHTGQGYSLGERGSEMVFNADQMAALAGGGGDTHHHYHVQTQHEQDVALAIAAEQKWQAMLHG